MVRLGHYGLFWDARGLLSTLSSSEMGKWLSNSGKDARALLQKAYPTDIHKWIEASSVVGDMALGVAATPAVCMVGNLATTVLGIGLAAVGSRVDGNIKVCQSPRALSLGFTFEQKE